MTPSLFPFTEYWWLYAAFSVLVIALVLVDLGLFHSEARKVSYKEASWWTVIWIGLALVFNYGLYHFSIHAFSNNPGLLAIPGFDPTIAARGVALEFLTGYIVEKSLSVDNLFVFVVVFKYFAIEPKYQRHVLFYGLLGALVFRAIFIALGALLMQYHAVTIFFGAFLIFTGVKMAFSPEKPIEPHKNPVIKVLKKIFPLTPEFHGQKFMVRQNGKVFLTPLFVALVFLEITDVVFAVDSVPAIFALTNEPFIVFTSNIFAILGLRSLFFLLSGAVEQFHLLKYGLSIVLVFVGLKMVWLNELFGGKFPIGISLAIIIGVIGASVLLSLIIKPKSHSGSGGA